MQLEVDLSKDELFDAMMTLKLNKVQGCDGLSLKFYCKFWKLLVDPLHDMYFQAIENGQLAMSTKRGVINLIPKRNHDPLEIKLWRPLTLLNYDYKLIAKAIVTYFT